MDTLFTLCLLQEYLGWDASFLTANPFLTSRYFFFPLLTSLCCEILLFASWLMLCSRCKIRVQLLSWSHAIFIDYFNEVGWGSFWQDLWGGKLMRSTERSTRWDIYLLLSFTHKDVLTSQSYYTVKKEVMLSPLDGFPVFKIFSFCFVCFRKNKVAISAVSDYIFIASFVLFCRSFICLLSIQSFVILSKAQEHYINL